MTSLPQNPDPGDSSLETSVAPAAGRTGPGDGRRRMRLVLGLVAAVVLWAALDGRGLLANALGWVEGMGPWGPVAFMAVYAVATVLLLPGSVLTLGAGALFGVVQGSIYVSIGSTCGAAAAFLVGRHLARDRVEAKLRGDERFAALDRAVAAEGWRIVLLTRLSPVFPFTVLNYAFGLTRVSFGAYLIASWIGMMPGTILYVFLGSAARAGVSGRDLTAAEWGLYGVGLTATLFVTLRIARIARAALGNRRGGAISP